MTASVSQPNESAVIHRLPVSMEVVISCFVSSFELLDDLLVSSRTNENSSILGLSDEEFHELRDIVISRYGVGPVKISQEELIGLAENTSFDHIVSPILDRLSGIIKDHIRCTATHQMKIRRLNMISNNKQGYLFDIQLDHSGNTIIGGRMLTVAICK